VAKTSGLGWTTFAVDDATGTPRDLKNDFLSVDVSTPRATFDVTGLDKYAVERLLGLADATVGGEMAFNPAADMGHAVFRTMSSTSVPRTVSLAHSSQTLAMEMLPTTYDLSRGSDGKLTSKVELLLQDGTAPTWGP
jgi:hypothetical protein